MSFDGTELFPLVDTEGITINREYPINMELMVVSLTYGGKLTDFAKIWVKICGDETISVT